MSGTANPYRIVTAKILAGKEFKVSLPTDFVALIDATDDTAVSVRFTDSGDASPLLIGLTPDRLRVREFWLVNDSAATNTVRIAIGSGSSIVDNRPQTASTSQDMNLKKINGASPVGRKTAAASLSAVLASDQPAVPVHPYALAADEWRYAAPANGIDNTAVAVPIKTSAGAGICNHITGLTLDWEALTNGTEVAIRDGAGGTVLWRGHIPAAIAGRREITFPTPLRGTAATLLEIVTLTASGAGKVYANAQGFVGA